MFGTIEGWEIFVLVSSLIGLLYAAIQSYLLLKIKVDDERALAISEYIRKGANAFMRRQYTTIFIFTIILAIIIFGAFAAYEGVSDAWRIAVGFVVGALGSAVAGLIGMNISLRGNVRAAVRAKSGLNPALGVAIRGGSVTGLTVISLALLGLVSFQILYNNPNLMIGFIFGASLVSLFARVGGGIFTKGADVGADLVGKIEQGLPEDDERNPAVIADNVGDNVGDCAGMGADLYETFVVTALASMLLASLFNKEYPNVLGAAGVILPLVLGAVALLSTIAGIFFVKKRPQQRIMGALYNGLIATVIFSLIGFAIVSYLLMSNSAIIFVDSLIGIIIMLIFVYVTEYYTSERFSPVGKIAKASTTGTGTNIITGMSFGLQAVFVPAIVIVVGIVVSYGITAHYFGASLGLYGISVSAAAMLSATGIIISIDSYGPITDNAGGIAEMSGFDEKTRNEVTDPLDAVGNTTKAVTKGYAIGSAVLAALTLFAAFKLVVTANAAFVGANFNIDNPLVLIGLVIGAMLPFFFTSYLMNSVGKAAYAIVEEVRKQFREHKGILDRTEKPDYGKAVDIVTREALHQLLIPALIGVVTPVLIGFVLGPLALGGVLIGVVLSGFPLAIFMTVSGGAWDNAKKYIEGGQYGGKGSEPHKAAVVGDTVGDATKDTAGPAINPLVKVVNTVSVLFVAIMLNHYLIMGIASLFP